VVERVEDLSILLHLDVGDLVEKMSFDADDAVRIRSLLDASIVLAFERERLEECGISLVSVYDEAFPPALRQRLVADLFDVDPATPQPRRENPLY
jgi:hypothetical protein